MQNAKQIDAQIFQLKERLFLAERDLRHVVDAEKSGRRSVALPSRKDAIAAIVAIGAELAPLQVAYSANPWSRYYLCRSHNGHIHANPHCSSLKVNSELAWLPELSDDSQVEVVEVYGADVCSVCCPDAPVVNWSKSGREREAAKAARDSKASAKAAKAAADAVVIEGTEYKSLRAANADLACKLDRGLDLIAGPFYRLQDAAQPEQLDAVVAGLRPWADAGSDVAKYAKSWVSRHGKGLREGRGYAACRLEGAKGDSEAAEWQARKDRFEQHLEALKPLLAAIAAAYGQKVSA